METVNNVNPEQDLGSIIRCLPLPPARKLAGLVALCPILERGTRADLAEALGKTKEHLSMVVSGKRPSESLKQDIAKFLGVRVRDIWPPEIENESLPTSLSAETQAHYQNYPQETR